ncbi:hypothetical protein CCMA1212_000361 [Trichoderma ghanense]|uniref:Uncharacterized protein n=1 Tax=Trichoderma ghanense TaxID=65468 RepID=A0ABY2HG60_9HYPO
MATVTAEDIRAVAERVRAAAEIVAPYDRREPYDFEIFEPLMKMLPKERVPYDPPPQRPDETDREYYLVWRNHFNMWLLQEIDDYFKVKGGRLPSPSSDIDDDDEVRAQEALYDQERVLRGMDIVEREFFDKPVTYENQDFEIPPEFWERQLRETRGKELPNLLSEDVGVSRGGNDETVPSSSGDRPQGTGRSSTNIWRSTEDGVGPAAEQQDMDGPVIRPSIEQSHERPASGNGTEPSILSLPQNSEPIQTRKRRRLPAEDHAVEIPSKKRRTDKHPQLSASSNTAGHKRKRDGEESLYKRSSTGESGEPRDKKRRLDAQWKPQPSQKRKRGFQEYDEELRRSQLGYEVPESKRRRVSTAGATNAEQNAQDAPTAAGSGSILAAASSLRITRARRRQLSGEDAQLLQLDQRGKPGVQEPKHSVQHPARKLSATSQNGRRPKTSASIDVKDSRRIKVIKGSMRASTIASTKDSITTKTTVKTRSRRGRGRLRST